MRRGADQIIESRAGEIEEDWATERIVIELSSSRGCGGISLSK